MKAESFYLIAMMFIIGMWFINDVVSSMLMLCLAFFWLILYVIFSKSEFQLKMLERKMERQRYSLLLQKLDSIEKLLSKNKKKRCLKKR
jgi:uncharacterized membrane protein YciS (DUF1049 family)